MREENSEVYTPINSKLKFGYFGKCYKSKNFDYNYVNEFYKNPFSINYWPGLVKAENIFQLIKVEDKNELVLLFQWETITSIYNIEDNQSKKEKQVSNLNKQILEFYFIQKQKPKIIASELKISKHRIYRIIDETKRGFI